MGTTILIGETAVAVETAFAAAVAVLFAILFIMALVSRRRAVDDADAADLRADVAERRAEEAERTAAEVRRAADQQAAAHANEMARRFEELARSQGAINGQMKAMSERIDGMSQRVSESMVVTANRTHEGLSKLGERLAVIDKAQQNITSLSGQVVELQHILANKQTRGAFGQARMEAIVRDGLPPSGYAFQPTLSNRNRPDCVILFPDETPDLVVDAKFPLEAWNLIRAAETPEETKAAEAQFRRDTMKHVTDIAARYMIPGETQETAFMFVPSESIFADLHERFEDVIQKAHRARVVIVSPSLLMLSIQVVMSLMRDARMREQAHLIQQEVMKLMDDVGRLDDRVRKLQTHFVQAGKDIESIVTSARKVTARGQAIQAVEVDDGEAPRPRTPPGTRDERRSDGRSLHGGPELPFSSVEEI